MIVTCHACKAKYDTSSGLLDHKCDAEDLRRAAEHHAAEKILKLTADMIDIARKARVCEAEVDRLNVLADIANSELSQRWTTFRKMKEECDRLISFVINGDK